MRSSRQLTDAFARNEQARADMLGGDDVYSTNRARLIEMAVRVDQLRERQGAQSHKLIVKERVVPLKDPDLVQLEQQNHRKQALLKAETQKIEDVRMKLDLVNAPAFYQAIAQLEIAKKEHEAAQQQRHLLKKIIKNQEAALIRSHNPEIEAIKASYKKQLRQAMREAKELTQQLDQLERECLPLHTYSVATSDRIKHLEALVDEASHTPLNNQALKDRIREKSRLKQSLEEENELVYKQFEGYKRDMLYVVRKQVALLELRHQELRQAQIEFREIRRMCHSGLSRVKSEQVETPFMAHFKIIPKPQLNPFSKKIQLQQSLLKYNPKKRTMPATLQRHSTHSQLYQNDFE